MSKGDSIFTQVRDTLSGEKKTSYLQALDEAKQGSTMFSSGDWTGCLTHSMRAHDLLSTIPEAAPILGTVKQDLAAAFGSLGRLTEAKKNAQDSIQLVQGIKELAFTESMANMTLGIVSYNRGDGQEGSKYFASARNLLKDRPGSKQILRVLDQNEAKLRADLSMPQKKEEVTVGSRPSETSAAPLAYTEPTTGIEMVLVKGGCYEMGDTFGDGYDHEKPVHEVCLDDFYLGKYQVTQRLWKALMGNNPSAFQNGDNYPVEQVNWNDAQDFIRKLNEGTGKRYRLPTEAEWEYAARSGGKKEKWSGTSNESELMKYAWFRRNARGKTHPVGRKRPNGLGLYDMSGNVCEWVQDTFSEDAYSSHSRENPLQDWGVYRVLRGGSWSFDVGGIRVASRAWWWSGSRDQILNLMGFRVARDL
jgi:sulfatase modifying factor 1